MTDTDARAEARSSRLELAIVVILGLASLGTAWATFQAALHDGAEVEKVAEAQHLRTEAESLYLEANQTYTQDANTLVRMAELQIAADASDDVAAAQREELVFMSVSDELAGAIERADEANQSDPSLYTSALDDEEYQQALFGSYEEAMEESAAATAAGRVSGGYSDRLTLATTVLAISLFVVGIAAVVRRERTRIILAAGGAAIMAVGLVVTLLVPIIWP